MKIYIASSWKNQHAVEMLTLLLRKRGCQVVSWVENNYGEDHNHVTKKFDFETWVKSPESDQSFDFDTNGAMSCDLFIYVGPAGKDAAAECGMCYGQRLKGRTIPMIALWAKSEDFGLMRKMFDYIATRYTDLLAAVDHFAPNPYACYGTKKPTRMDFNNDDEFEHRLSAWQKFEDLRPALA